MGRKLEGYIKKAGFEVFETVTLNDQEFSFSGPAPKEVVTTWQKRFDRMMLLHKFCGSNYENFKNDFYRVCRRMIIDLLVMYSVVSVHVKYIY